MANHFQENWNQSRRILSGGFPYSEGIFEDINKVIASQFYWNSDRKAKDAVKEYIAYEFSPDVVEEVAEAIEILESNHQRGPDASGYGNYRIVKGEDGLEHCVFKLPGPDAGAEQCLAMLRTADGKLTDAVRQCWRWRILLLRGLIDNELYRTDGVPTTVCEEAFDELTRIYHAQGAESSVCPPGRESIRRLSRK